MDKEVRIVISSGLLLLAFIHAGMVATATRLAPRIEQSLGIPPIDAPSIQGVPRTGIDWDAMQSASDALPRRSLPVNAAARDEMKQGGAAAFVATRQAQLAQVQHSPACVPCQPTVRPALQPAIAAPKVTPLETTPKNQLILFVGTDAKSQQLLTWFNSDPQLRDLKAKTNFNVFTRDNALYKSRYAAVVPVEFFPAALLAAPDGGHIHVAFGDMMPADGATLYSDFSKAYKLQRQVLAQRRNATVSSSGIGAMESVPDVGLVVDQIQDCIDGNCDPNREPFNGDRDRVFPIFDRDRSVNPIEGILRALTHPTESILVIALGGVIVYLVMQRMRG